MALKVLIAHGNTQRLKQAVSDLHSAGFDVVATPDGGDAFARFFEEMPDVVICSLVLPGLSGDNIARMVRSQSPGTEIVLLIEHEGQHEEPGINIVVEPMTLSKLQSAMPSIAFDAPLGAEEEASGADLTAASPTHVFFHAVLKRFQRDNRALQALDDTGIGKIAAIADNKNFQDGERIIKQGDDGDGCYLLVEGQVKVTLQEKEDKEVARISAGGFFGEMAMLKDLKRSASVWSIGQTTTLWFSKELFSPILAEYPQMREVLSGVALKRTEENLWRVLFDDDEVQKSIAQLGDAPTLANAGTAPAPVPAPVPAAGQTPIAAPAGSVARRSLPQVAAFTKTIAPAAVLSDEPKASWRTTIKERAFQLGAGAGFFAGVLLTALVALSLRGPTPVDEHTVTEPASLPASAPASQAVGEPASEPTSAPASLPTEMAQAASQEIPPLPAPASQEATPAPAPKKNEPKIVASPDRDALVEAYSAGKYRQVLQSAKKLQAPLDGDAQFMICDAERHLGLPNALPEYLSFIKNYPDHGRTDDAQYWAADLLAQQGKIAEARALFEKVAANAGSNFKNSAVKRLEK
ncbi:MAG: cyclic nucleotide-binding domain-containing protein [Deltaproteobacteria bacterium]|nr:cyclic nucleotide-binding domain-containing protein [Deltaproteobacteria bacterium]